MSSHPGTVSIAGSSVSGSDDSNSSLDEEDQYTPPHPTAVVDAPFTEAQQKALANTIKSALKESRKCHRSRHHHIPTISSSSDSEPRWKGTYFSAHPKSCRHSPNSSTESSTDSCSHSPSSSSSSSPASPRHRHCHIPRHSHVRSNHHGKSSHHTRDKHRHPHALPVQHKVRHAIERGEYVELNKLLVVPLGSGKSKKSSCTWSITSLESWLEAWSTFAAVLSTHNRDLAPDLFQYQAFITRSSLRFQPYAWLQYDIQFRLKLAANPSLRWASTDTELVATWLSADAAKRTASCFSCGCPDHLSADCPLRPPTKSLTAHCSICKASGHIARDCPQLPSDKRSKSGPEPKDDKYCRIYNRRGSCFRESKCTYYHACSQCNGGHPRCAYPQAR